MVRLAFHIGFHKTATTWFQTVALPSHPGLVPYLDGPPSADPYLRHLVTDHDARWDPATARAALDRRIARLAPAGRMVVISAERLSGHLASGGHDAHRIARRIAETAPEAKVWFLSRDPAALLASEYRQLVGEGFPGTLDQLVGADPWKQVGYDPGYYDFDALEASYARLLGADRVHQWRYEELLADRRGVLDALAGFLGVEPFPLTDRDLERRVHPGVPDAAVGTLRRLNRVRRSELNPFPVVSIGDWWRRPVIRLARAWSGRNRRPGR